MLTQCVQHLATHPGPLGAFFRRIARRKGCQVAVTATARKVVVIAYLMLKHNESYRYTKPEMLHRKFNRLRKTAGEPTSRRSADLAETCRDAGLTAPLCFDELPAGKRRVLAETGTEGFARQVGSRADVE